MSGLLEREDEQAAIEHLLASVVARRGSALLFEGEAGLGKTSLLDVASRAGGALGCRVLRARGEVMEREFAFGIVRQLFSGLRHTLTASELGEVFSGAAALAGPLIGFQGGADTVVHDPAAAFHGLYWLTAGLCELAPLLLIVDDAHAGDDPSLGWLFYLARRLEGSPIGVIVAARSAYTEREPLRALAAEPLVRGHALAGLTLSATEALARERLGAHLDLARVEHYHAVTSGNPLYLGELLRDTLAGARAPSARAQTGTPHGDGLASLLRRRLGRLSASARSLLEAAAVLGADSDVRVAATLAGLDADDAVHAAAELRSAGLVGLEPRLTFKHPVVRETLHGGLETTARRAAHVRAAALLAARRAPAEEISAHLLLGEAGELAEAPELLRRAARDAVARAAPESAVRYLERALEEPLEDGRRFGLLSELAAAAELADDPRTTSWLSAALRLAPDAAAAADIRLALARVLLGQGQAAHAVAVLEQAIEPGGGGDAAVDLRLRCGLLGAAKTLNDQTGWPPERIRALERRIRELIGHAAIADTAAERAALAILSAHGDLTITVAAAIADARRTMAGDRLLRELPIGSPAVSVAFEAFVWAGVPDEAISHLDVALQIAQAQGAESAAALVLAHRAEARWAMGDLAAAEADAAGALELGPGRRFLISALFAAAWLTVVWVERGQTDAAAALLRERGLDGALGPQTMFVPLRFARGSLALAGGDHRSAVTEFTAAGAALVAGDLARPGVVPWRPGAATAHAGLGEMEAARRLLADELRDAERIGAAVPRAIALRVAASMNPDRRAAAEQLRDSVGALEHGPAKLELARSLGALGGSMRRAGERREAREPLRRALDLSHRCGAWALHREVAAELLTAGARPRRDRITGRDALTAAERRVAGLAAEGLSNREIAQRLFVTVKTVETHLGHVYTKLGVRSRSGLAAQLTPSLVEAV
jgi:DNA-binding CsgD family transcriptional regulator